jgi:RNA polymerase sigma factor (sigma-70 family)
VLAVRARDGDNEAAGELFRRIRDRARRRAAGWCDRRDLDDAVAEGFARALASLAQLREPAAVEHWILRCVARAAIDQSRRAARQRPSGMALDLDSRVAPGPSAADAALAARDRLALRQALDEVPEHHRRLLDLRFGHGLTVREIAEQLGAPEGTLRRHCVEASRLLEQGFLRRQLCPAAGPCAPVTRLLCKGARRELSGPATRTVSAHLQYCGGCRRRRDELGSLMAGLRRRAG